MIETSVIVPVRDAAGTLGRALECLRAQRAPFAYEVVVVDDGSSDGSAEIAEAAGEPVRLVRAHGAAGPADARNAGVLASSGRLLAFCDADCFPVESWLAAGVAALERADLVQGRVLPDPDAAIGPFDRSLWVTRAAGLWETANLFLARDLFDRVGGFSDWLPVVAGKAMAEDVWLGWRAVRAGARPAFCAEALVHHAVFAQGPRAYVAERRRRRHFPQIAARMPEVRDAFLYRRLFLDRRTAAFDLALAGGALAALSRRPWPLAAALPYAVLARRRALPFAGRRAQVLAVDLAADAVSAWALARGSVAARSAVL